MGGGSELLPPFRLCEVTTLENHINIDIETYSDVDLSKCGVYKYAESPDFEILLFGYAVDGGEVAVWSTWHSAKKYRLRHCRLAIPIDNVTEVCLQCQL